MLRVTGLKKRYGDSEGSPLAVDDVTFEVASGEFFTLLGPSGCGKTTTLRCIAGLEIPDVGTIRIGEDTVFSGTHRRSVPVHRRDIAMVFQSYAIWPHMTVEQNVAFPLEATRVPRKEFGNRVREALRMVGLEELADRPVTLLSGGQQQRVAFARAVVKGSKLLLLDEPLSNLDAKLRVQMRTELRELQRRLGTTTIYVTHDQEEALSLSDRIAVMSGGRIVEIGAPLELYMTPQQVFTARFIGQADLWDGEIVERQAEGTTVRTPLGPIVASVCPTKLTGRVHLLVRPEHVRVLAADDRDRLDVNVLRGTVRSVAFSGKLLDYLVDVNGHKLRVQTLASEPCEVGDAIDLHLPPERCVILAPENSTAQGQPVKRSDKEVPA